MAKNIVPSCFLCQSQPFKVEEINYRQKKSSLKVKNKNDGERMRCRAKVWLRFNSQIETDVYSRVKTCVIKFAKGIDYMSSAFSPRRKQ